MQKVAILTDSSCDLSREEREQQGLFTLPLRIIYKDAEYLDHLTISPKEIYDRLETEVPSTSLPSPECMDKIFDSIEKQGYTHVIGIFLSSSLSGTMNAIRLQIQDRTAFKYELFDSGIVGYPLGRIVLKAYELIQNGKSYEDVLAALPNIKANTSGYYTLNTLEYLKKGGRIGRVAGTIGELLHIKPIITVGEDGSYVTAGKARGRKQSIKKLKDIANNLVNDAPCRFYVLHGSSLEEAKEMLETFKNHPNVIETDIRDIGPAMGVHAGPGMLAFAIQKES